MDDNESKAGTGAAEGREVVGLLASREAFEAAVKALLAAGFEREDLSVLATHESLAAADPPEEAARTFLAGLLGEVPYVGPIAAAGFIMVAAGPVGELLAGAIAAGLGGLALKELLEDVLARPHSEAFAQALKEGRVALWVRVADAGAEEKARRILAENGARDIHTTVRGG